MQRLSFSNRETLHPRNSMPHIHRPFALSRSPRTFWASSEWSDHVTTRFFPLNFAANAAELSSIGKALTELPQCNKRDCKKLRERQFRPVRAFHTNISAVDPKAVEGLRSTERSSKFSSPRRSDFSVRPWNEWPAERKTEFLLESYAARSEAQFPGIQAGN